MVLSIKERLGAFIYDPPPNYKDNIKRVMRGLITLENGARYEGEWDEDRNMRDGRGK